MNLTRVDKQDLEVGKTYFYRVGTAYTLYTIQYSTYYNAYFAHPLSLYGKPIRFEDMKGGIWYGPVNVVEK